MTGSGKPLGLPLGDVHARRRGMAAQPILDVPGARGPGDRAVTAAGGERERAGAGAGAVPSRVPQGASQRETRLGERLRTVLA